MPDNHSGTTTLLLCRPLLYYILRMLFFRHHTMAIRKAMTAPYATNTDHMATEPSSPSPSRRRRLLFDRRYGWIFDEWREPADEAFAGGRGMFCLLPIAKSLLNAAANSINFVADSVTKALRSSHNFSSPANFSPVALHGNQPTWCREVERCGVVADLKLVPCRAHLTFDDISTH